MYLENNMLVVVVEWNQSDISACLYLGEDKTLKPYSTVGGRLFHLLSGSGIDIRVTRDCLEVYINIGNYRN